MTTRAIVDDMDELMLLGEERLCPDCGTETLFLPVDAEAWVCTDTRARSAGSRVSAFSRATSASPSALGLTLVATGPSEKPPPVSSFPHVTRELPDRLK